MEKIYNFFFNYKTTLILLILFFIINTFVSYYLCNYLYDSNEPIVVNNDLISINDKDDEENSNFYVDIKGYVKKPGVYEVNNKMNVNDLINKAGGIKSSGTTANINLSKLLSNEMVVIISNKNDLEKKTEVCPICECSNVEISDCKEVKSDIIGNIEEDIIGNKISINNASMEELMSLDGIGESKALAIIEYRNINKFLVIEDIMNVSGIGESIFVKIKEDITI